MRCDCPVNVAQQQGKESLRARAVLGFSAPSTSQQGVGSSRGKDHSTRK